MHEDRKNKTRRARASQICWDRNKLRFILGKSIGYSKAGTPEEPYSGTRTKPIIQHLMKSEELVDLMNIPVSWLLILKGMFCEQQVTTLKDESCKINVLSNDFVRGLHYQHDLPEANIEISHSQISSTENSRFLVANAKIQISKQAYTSNWSVVHTWYDVLLVISWHKGNNLATDYATEQVTVSYSATGGWRGAACVGTTVRGKGSCPGSRKGNTETKREQEIEQ